MEKTRTKGQFIADLRKSKRLTQSQFGEMLNVSDKTVSRWENDITISDIDILFKISDIFEVSVDDLLRGKKNSIDENKKKKTKIKFLLNIVFILFLIGLAIKICDIYNKCTIYSIYSVDEEYVVNGNLIYTPKKNILYIGSVSNPYNYLSNNDSVYAYEIQLRKGVSYIYTKDYGMRNFDKENSKITTKLENIIDSINIYIEEEHSESYKLSNNNEDYFIIEIIYINQNYEQVKVAIPLATTIEYANNILN